MLRSESPWWRAGFTEEWWDSLGHNERGHVLGGMSDLEAESFAKDWRVWGRDDQLGPPGRWRSWTIKCGRGWGKALALDTPIPTPAGWTTMQEVSTGDEVFDETGAVRKIVKAHDVLHGRDCYEVKFSDGSTIVADAEHLWLTETKASRKAAGRSTRTQIWPAVRTTQQIGVTLEVDGERNHSVPCALPLALPDRALPIDPYVLGAWLGDGTSRYAEITTADVEMLDHIRAAGEPVGKPRSAGGAASTYPLTRGYVGRRVDQARTLTGRLRRLDVLNNKHIPDAYLRASANQRLSLLQGLMDTDGYGEASKAEFCSTRRELAVGVSELVASLGMIPRLAESRAMLNGRDCGPRYRVTFRPRLPVFRLQRKLARVAPLGRQGGRTARRFIVAVRLVASVPVRCITVDSPSALYLCGHGMIPTHNTKTAVEVIIDKVERGEKGRICLLGQGEDDVRDVMIEGRSGFLTCSKSWFRPTWRPSRGGGMLEWPNGALGYVYSAEDPEALRGPEFDFAWIDEIMAFKADARQKAESNLRFGLRLPPNPQRIYTTTPKPHKWLKDHLKKINPERGIYLTNGTTFDNRKNLAEEFIESIEDDYKGTRLGKQELYGDVLSDSDNALWSSEGLDQARIMQTATDDEILSFSATMDRIVVAVDPNISATGRSHAAGITVIGVRGMERYLLADRTSRKGPEGWAKDTILAFDDFKANEVVAEVNQGGDLVRSVIEGAARDAGRDISVVKVHATRGKQKRAEPVAAAYERKKILHVGPADRYAALETQMTELHEGLDTTGEDFDRVDSLVWGMTRLAQNALSSGSVGGGSIMSFDQFTGA